MNTRHFTTVLLTTRPAFLILTPVCVLLGLSLQWHMQGLTNFSLSLIILIGAVCAHISVNTLNEYLDFNSGLDLQTDKTPFSGGSGALPSDPGAARMTLTVGIASLLITCVIGIYLLVERGSSILPVGIVGLLVIIFYTTWINRHPVLCLLAPGLGFGLFMVVGTHVVITGQYAWPPLLVALVPFFLVNNLLLLNQYPDMAADASIGRRTFPIVYGTGMSNRIYALFFTSAYLLIIHSIYIGFIPLLATIALAPVVFSIYSLRGAVIYAQDIGSYPRYLGANVAATLLTPLLLAIAIISG